MSAYDDAVAYLDAEVHPRCDYDIYSDMMDIVDEMEADNAKLRELLKDIYASVRADEDNCDVAYVEQFEGRMRKLGVEVDG